MRRHCLFVKLHSIIFISSYVQLDTHCCRASRCTPWDVLIKKELQWRKDCRWHPFVFSVLSKSCWQCKILTRGSGSKRKWVATTRQKRAAVVCLLASGHLLQGASPGSGPWVQLPCPNWGCWRSELTRVAVAYHPQKASDPRPRSPEKRGLCGAHHSGSALHRNLSGPCYIIILRSQRLTPHVREWDTCTHCLTVHSGPERTQPQSPAHWPIQSMAPKRSRTTCRRRATWSEWSMCQRPGTRRKECSQLLGGREPCFLSILSAWNWQGTPGIPGRPYSEGGNGFLATFTILIPLQSWGSWRIGQRVWWWRNS
jgi:hypothetical protein